MAKKLQLRGGTTLEHSTFTGAVREVTVDTDKDTLVVHDGATAGGIPLAKATDTDLLNDTSPQLGGDLDLNGHEILGLPPANEHGFVASGALSSGDIVSLNSDGTVSVVVGIPAGVGTEVVFDATNIVTTSSAYDPTSGKVVVVYRDASNSYIGMAVVGTVSGTSISFGTPVVFNNASSRSPGCSYDSANNKFVITYSTASGSYYYGYAVVGTVSGTSISFGTPAVFNNVDTYWSSMYSRYDATNGKIVISYLNTSGQPGYVKLGTVSGTSITFGSANSYCTGYTQQGGMSDIVNGKFVIAHQEYISNAYRGMLVVGSISGNTVSMGTPFQFHNAVLNPTPRSLVFTASGKVVITYKNTNAGLVTAVVGTLSGTSISLGTSVTVGTANDWIHAIDYDSVNDKVLLAVSDGTLPAAVMYVGTVSGTSISFDAAVVVNSGGTSYLSLVSLNNGKAVMAFGVSSTTPATTGASIFSLASTNLPDVVGITTGAIADTATGAVTLSGGISTGHTGLTINANYYVTDAGALSTTAGSNTRIGRALSATELLLEEIGE